MHENERGTKILNEEYSIGKDSVFEQAKMLTPNGDITPFNQLGS